MHIKQTLVILDFLKPFHAILQTGWYCAPVGPTQDHVIVSVMKRYNNVNNFPTSVGGTVASECVYQGVAETSVLDTLAKSWQTIIDEHNESAGKMVDT